MLKLKLTKDKRFMHDALSNCKVEIEFAPASADYAPANPGTPDLETTDPNYVAPTDQVGTAAVKAEGVFRIMDTGAGSDCVITARGELSGEEPLEVADPSAIKATLTADAVKRISFAKGVALVDTKIPWAADEALPTVVGAAPGRSSNNTLTLTREHDDVACVMDIVFEGVTVATGRGDDPNCNGKFWINQVGEVHIDAVCNWARCSGLKPNPTHFRIRGVNSHAKIFTLGVKDATHTANTSGE